MSVSLYGSGNTVIQATNTALQSNSTYFSTSSSSLVATGLTVSITPQSTNSKILLIASFACNGSTTGSGQYTIYRGSTNLATGTAPSILSVASYNGNTAILTWLDSPSTTSSTTYQIYACTNTGTLYMGYPSGASASTGLSFTALEISGS